VLHYEIHCAKAEKSNQRPCHHASHFYNTMSLKQIIWQQSGKSHQSVSCNPLSSYIRSGRTMHVTWWNLCGLEQSWPQKSYWNYSPACAREHAQSRVAAAWRQVWSVPTCVVSSMRIWQLMIIICMGVGTLTVRMWKINMGKCIHRCRLLTMASRKMFPTFLVFLFGFSWVRLFFSLR